MMAMEDGYYWLQLEGGKLEVVEIINGDVMYRCGSDVGCFLEGNRWIEFGEPLDVVSIIGPISPPSTIQARAS